MARPMKPLVRGGGYYPSRKWTPLVYAGGYTTANGGEEPAPPPIEKTVTGNPIHILDALAKPAQALSVKLEPIQDLHGYDAPWPAGGGKNKLNKSLMSDVDANMRTIMLTLEPNTDYTASTTLPLYGGSTANFFFHLPGESESTANNGVFSSRSRTLTTGADGMAVVAYRRGPYTAEEYLSYTYQVEKGSSATDYAPYSNICPISGHTDADVTRTGKNMLDDSYSSDKTNTLVLPNGTYYAQAWLTESPSKHTTNPEVLINGTWISATPPFNSNGVSVTGTSFGWLYSNATQTITVTGGPIVIRYSRNDAAMATRRLSLSPVQLTEFSEYVGTTYPIPLGQTVYGGTLDVKTGKLTVDRAIVDLGTLTWVKNANGTYSTFDSPSLTSVIEKDTNSVNAICSCYSSTSDHDAVTSQDNRLFIDSNGRVRAKETAKSALTETEYKTYITGQTLVYKLATPIEITLTPTQIDMLLGENNLWADAGDLTLTYYADGNASDVEALNILLGGRYVNNHGEDEPTDREALDIVLGGKK